MKQKTNTDQRKQSNKLSKKYYKLMKEGLKLMQTDKKEAEKKFALAAKIIQDFESPNGTDSEWICKKHIDYGVHKEKSPNIKIQGFSKVSSNLITNQLYILGVGVRLNNLIN